MVTVKTMSTPMTTAYDKLLSTRELSGLIGIPIGTLKQWRSTGIGPDYFELTPGTIRYDLRDVLSYIESKRRRASTRAS